MKKNCLLLLALCVSLFTQANPVDMATANSIAKKFLQSKIEVDCKARGLHQTQSETEVDMALVYEPSTADDVSEYYVFAPSDAEGFVIVSGEDTMEPIIGYSLTNGFSTEQMPPALKEMLSSYAQFVDDVRAGKATPVTRAEREIAPVDPLITTTWDQYYPYNYYCPEINGQKTLTGCVATAAAQIMKYYEWPRAGHGTCTATLSDGNNTPVNITLSEEYDWDNMKDSYRASYTELEAQAVGLLMRDVGYACNLTYGVNVTLGGVTVPGALFRHFDYSSSLQFIRKDFYSEAAWNDMLYNELLEERPIYYAASDNGGGHAFVCCGIDQNGAYYVNWGWGGNNDGYYYIDDFRGYNLGPNAVIGIKPVSEDGSEEDMVAVPQIRVAEIRNQNTSLSAPSVAFYLNILNGTVNPISGQVGYALFENGNMISSEIQMFDAGCSINGMGSISQGSLPLQLAINDASGFSQGGREIRFFWQPAGSEEWFEPMGDGYLYMMTTTEGHCFSTEKIEVEVSPAVVEDGAYYLKNVGTGKFLTAANDWGTRASIANHGLDVTITRLPNGKYTIDTQIGTEEGKHFLGLDDKGVYYMDVAEMGWTIGVLENGNYVFSKHDALPIYLRGDATRNMVDDIVSNPMEDENVQWQLLARKDMVDCLSLATVNDPVDATFFISGANFGRVDSRNGAWNGAPTIGGLNSNSCAEKSNEPTFDVNQRLTGLPNGFYELRVQGFYREGGGANNPEIAASNYAEGISELNAILYANEESVPLASIMSEAQREVSSESYFYNTAMGYVPQSAIGASLLFNEELYQHSLIVEVTDGVLCVGVRKDVVSANDWACFDNFELYYYGLNKPQPKPEGISSISKLDNGTFYQVLLPYHGVSVTSWAVAQGGSIMQSNVDINAEVNKDDTRQQFAFISYDEGTTHYLYHPAEKKFVNKDGSLGVAPQDPVYFKDGAYKKTFVVYFDNSHFVNVNGNQLLLINNWGPGSGWGNADGGNSCLIVPAGSFEFVEPEPKPGIELDNETIYHVTQPYRGGTSWAVAKGGAELTINTELGIEANSADERQQFKFISNDGGKTRYLYHPAEKKYVNKDASLSATAQDPVYFKEGMHENSYVVYFDNSHFINTNEREGLIINDWGPGGRMGTADEGNSCAITAVEVEPELKYTTQFNAGANGWIDGTEWYNPTEKIVAYTSPLYRAQGGKVTKLRITVNRDQKGDKFFCLSELEFYDANGSKIALTASNITSNADHNTLNPTAPDGGSFAALFDGQTSTYFHSAWKNMPGEDHYLEITFPNGGYDAFNFKMLSRGRSFENGRENDQSHTFPGVMVMNTAVELVVGGTPEPEPDPQPNLNDETLYYVTQTYHEKGATSWAIAQGGNRLQTNVELGIAADGKDVRQQFAFISDDGGRSYYVYHPAERKYVNMDGFLSTTPQDVVLFTAGAYDNTFVAYFDKAHFINVDQYRMLLVNDWGPGGRIGVADGGNSNSFTAVDRFVTEVSPMAEGGLLQVRKVIEDGELYVILPDGSKYTMTGVRVK